MNTTRRKFLKIIFIGSGAFLLEKVLGPLFSRFSNDAPAKTVSSDKIALSNKTDFRNFRIIEDKTGLFVYDNSGKEIFQIDDRA